MALSSEDREEIKDLIKDGNAEMVLAFDRRFISLGIDIDDPIKVQSQQNFLAKITKIADRFVSKIVVYVMAFVLVAALGLAGLGKFLKLGG